MVGKGGDIAYSPCSAGLPDAKVEFLKMANCVLFVLPIGPFPFDAEPALEPVFHLLQESVVCPRETEPMVVIHSVDFVLRQGTPQCVCIQFFREGLRDPGDREVLPSSLPG